MPEHASRKQDNDMAAVGAAALLALGDAVDSLLQAGVTDYPVDDGTGLRQLADVLRFVGEQRGAALVELMNAVLATGERDPDHMPAAADIADCASLLQGALRAMAFGHSMPAACFLRCWQQLSAITAKVDAHPCQLLALVPDSWLDATQVAYHVVPASQAKASPLSLVADFDRALLDFLRSEVDSDRQRAAQIMATALAGIAARQSNPQDQLRWQAMQAYASEVAAGQRYELARTKRILSTIGRQLRLFAGDASHVLPDDLLRAALYELAQCSCLTAIANQIADIYSLHGQNTLKTAASGSRLVDEDTVFEQSLQRLLASKHALPDKPMAGGIARAIADALRACVAAIERRINEADEHRAWDGAVEEMRTIVMQMDVCLRMLDHAGLQAKFAQVTVALDELVQRAASDECRESAELWLPFAVRLAAIEASLAMLPFSWTATDAQAELAAAGKPESEAETETEADSEAEAEVGVDVMVRGSSEPETDVAPVDSSLRKIFTDEARARLDSLRASLAAWEASPSACLPVKAGIDAHALAGSSATAGWPAIHLLSHSLEQACDVCCTRMFAAEDAGLLRDAIAAIGRLIEASLAGDDAGPDDGKDAMLIDRLRQLAGSADHAKLPMSEASDNVCAVAVADCQPDAELRAIFDEEAADLLPQLDHAMRCWLTHPEDTEPPAHLMRVLHTLKGSARMAGEPVLGDAFHRLESRVAGLVDDGLPSAESLLALQREFDDLCAIVREGASPPRERVDANEAVAPDAILHIDPPSTSPLASATARPGAEWPADTSTRLRIPAGLLARITDAAAELMSGMHQASDDLRMLRQQVGEFTNDLSRLRAQLRELEIEADARIASHDQQGVDANFDPLEFDRYTRVHEITRAMSESVADLAEIQRALARQAADLIWNSGLRQRQLRAMHADLLQAGTSPFGSLEARLSQALRQALRDVAGSDLAEADRSTDGEREAHLLIDGGELAVDRRLLERLAAPLEHLIRNAIAHGIEPASERERLGKPRCGSVCVRLSGEANQWRLEVVDDGRGLDLARISARAASLGVGRQHDAANTDASDEAAAELIFLRGLSTRDAVSDLSGRGVGMDAVRAEVQSLGGAIRVSSEPGQGCRFVLTLPLTLAILPVLVCRAGPHCIGLPSAMLVQVLRLDAQELAAASSGDSFAWQGAVFRWRSLSAMLGAPSSVAARRTTVLLLSQAGSTLALAVDAIDARRELTLRDPGPQLLSVPGMIGASPAPDGGIVLVMNPFALADAALLGVTAVAGPALAGHEASGLSDTCTREPPAILVIDDSLTVRRASQRLLQKHGYRVLLARDGAEALALLTSTEADIPRPHALLLDIEMPKMDGFELLAILRGDARWQDLPVVMITSRTADKHRERALQLGATAYVGKPYREAALLDLLASLVAFMPPASEPAAAISSGAR